MIDRVLVAVRVTPRAGRDVIGTVDDEGRLMIRVAAPPADSAANTAVTRLVAKALGVPRGAVLVASGSSNRNKRLAIDGVSVDDVARRWPGVSVRRG